MVQNESPVNKAEGTRGQYLRLFAHTMTQWVPARGQLQTLLQRTVILCGESDSENAPVITQSREDAEVRQICKRRAGQRGNWTVEFIL